MSKRTVTTFIAIALLLLNSATVFAASGGGARILPQVNFSGVEVNPDDPIFGDSADSEPEKVYSKLPVKEVTVFKDGHAFIIHEGTAPTDVDGNVLFDFLPNPVMGTFWAFSSEDKAELNSVISSRDELEVELKANNINDMLEGNIGKNAIIKDSIEKEAYSAQILRIPNEESYSNNRLVLLKTDDGIKAIQVNQIQTVTFLDDPIDTVKREQTKDTMKLVLDWEDNRHRSQAKVGMAYVQRGIRWIPNYRIEIDGYGKAVVKLQATIINELVDVEDVSMHLVIGVPSFAFQGTADPISFRDTVAQLSSHFTADLSNAYFTNNSVMSQSAGISMPVGDTINLGPEMEGTEQTEDLFVFNLEHITLKKGQRMVVPVTEFTLDYEDIYTVDINFAPPLEMRRNFSSSQQQRLAKEFHKINAIHKIRMTNDSKYPLTTAPAMVIKNGKVLCQGMMKYTAIGNKGDLELTTAVNIGVEHSGEQTDIVPNSAKWNGDNYSKVDMKGEVVITNYSGEDVTIHVSRSVLGNMNEADHEGTVKQMGNGYDGVVFADGEPFWWNWCNWPWWWYRFNTIGEAEWEVELKAKKSITLNYDWHYYWN